MHSLKAIRNTGIAAALLIVLLSSAGIIYSLLQKSPAPIAKVETGSVADSSGVLTPTPPSPTSLEGVAIEGISPPVKAGNTVSVNAQTNAGSTCKIDVDSHATIPNRSTALQDKTADAYGGVSWTWSVGPENSPGTYSLGITCTYNGRSGVMQGNFVVQ